MLQFLTVEQILHAFIQSSFLMSQEADVDWRNMIEDARRRHLIRTIPSGGDFSRAAKQILI